MSARAAREDLERVAPVLPELARARLLAACGVGPPLTPSELGAARAAADEELADAYCARLLDAMGVTPETASSFAERYRLWKKTLHVARRLDVDVRMRFRGAWGMDYVLERRRESPADWTMCILRGWRQVEFEAGEADGPEDALERVRAAWLYNLDGRPLKSVPESSLRATESIASGVFPAASLGDPRHLTAATEAVRRVMYDPERVPRVPRVTPGGSGGGNRRAGHRTTASPLRPL